MFETIEFVQFLVSIAVIPIIAGYAIRVWRQNAAAIEKGIEAEIGEKWWSLIQSAAYTLINAAEQVTGIDTNEEKKKFVLDHLYALTTGWNIPVTYNQLDVIIEGVYKAWVKDEQEGAPGA